MTQTETLGKQLNFNDTVDTFKATNVELNAGTDDTKYTTSAQHNIFITQSTRSTGSATGVQSFAHGLGRIPRMADIRSISVDTSSHFYSDGHTDGTVHACIFLREGPGSTSGNPLYGNSSTFDIIASTDGIFIGPMIQTGTITFDATNVNINWVKTGDNGQAITIRFLLKAY